MRSPLAEEALQLRLALEQACRDLQQAHNEILRAQGCPESEWQQYDWPRWTPQANTIRQAEKLADRFWAKVDRNGECWEWQAHKVWNGYGRFRVGSRRDGTNRMVLAHRVAYELEVGPIPDGLTIDHLCRNRSCVNPAHLEAVTMRENNLRGNNMAARHARQTHCVNGHEFTPENTRIGRTGNRVCRACRRERNRA